MAGPCQLLQGAVEEGWFCGTLPLSRRLHSERPILPLKGEIHDCLGVGHLGNPESGLPCAG